MEYVGPIGFQISKQGDEFGIEGQLGAMSPQRGQGRQESSGSFWRDQAVQEKSRPRIAKGRLKRGRVMGCWQGTFRKKKSRYGSSIKQKAKQEENPRVLCCWFFLNVNCKFTIEHQGSNLIRKLTSYNLSYKTAFGQYLYPCFSLSVPS